MKLGSEILLSQHKDLLRGKRVGILAHAASVDSSGRHIVNALIDGSHDGGWRVAALFGPEHGMEGMAQDMEPVAGQTAKYKLQIYSLYGDSFESLSPTHEMLEQIDLLVVDLQDIGARYYTYANTMILCMRACAAAGKEVIVCDRPNPINGVDTEGDVVEDGFRSFVGMLPILVRHGMTIGEIARFAHDHEFILRPWPPRQGRRDQDERGDFLHIIPMSGWRREWFWDETGLKWINPSPNMRSLAAALLYPGMCLLEGTNVSEGRGTHTPFEVCGAPWIDKDGLAKKLISLSLAGISFEPAVFTPTSRKFSGERCEGIKLIVTDRKAFRPYLTGLSLIRMIASSYPRNFRWRREPYEFVSDIPAIDLLTGSDKFRKSFL